MRLFPRPMGLGWRNCRPAWAERTSVNTQPDRKSELCRYLWFCSPRQGRVLDVAHRLTADGKTAAPHFEKKRWLRGSSRRNHASGPSGQSTLPKVPHSHECRNPDSHGCRNPATHAQAGCIARSREVFGTHLQCRSDDKRASRECKNRPSPAQVGCIQGTFRCTIRCTNSALLTTIEHSHGCRSPRIPAQVGCSAGCREVFGTHLQCRPDDKWLPRECKNGPCPAQVGCIQGSFRCTIRCTNSALLTTIEPSYECRNAPIPAQARRAAGAAWSF